eukprot:CAMPEP_0170465934 /NCGR_PEP_ID=MMETSP0123-20130129/10090_1 /TAXON_ID=182087 /ORGANISM="Favella ehrenbergii, Strain Fehren 1" /LENGTH=213 /DNA_ID=CAMNT_0010731951 /DNA_START=8 /DNA_END=649 /DNA_ORIENTATION=-
MRIDKCYFCSCNVYPGRGTAFVRNDAKTFRFCSSKCNKLFKAKKNPRKLKWTKAYRMAHGKEMTNDAVLEFEQKRNIPTRYNRDLMVKTLQAMKKVDQIKKARQERFFNARMERSKGQKRQSIENELMTDVDLITNPKVKAFILKKKKAKEELKRHRQSGGERGLAARKAKGIHAKLDLESASDDDVMDVNSSEDEMEAEPVKEVVKAVAKVK